jgi:hypothetical protein
MKHLLIKVHHEIMSLSFINELLHGNKMKIKQYSFFRGKRSKWIELIKECREWSEHERLGHRTRRVYVFTVYLGKREVISRGYSQK